MRCDGPAGSKPAQVFVVRVTAKASTDEEELEQLYSKTILYTPQLKR